MNAMQRGQINADAHMAAFGRPVKVAVNLATLTKLGFLLKGKKKMFVVYLGNVYTGDLTEKGRLFAVQSGQLRSESVHESVDVDDSL